MRSNRSTNPKSGRQAYEGCCDICSTSSTSRWYKKFLPGKVICKKCYDVERRKSPDIKSERYKNRANWGTSFKAAKLQAKCKNMEFTLSQEDWIDKTKDCSYCGVDLSGRGGMKLDRVDNVKGYTNDNTVGCCRTCNVAKNNMTLSDFKNWIEAVYQRIKSI